MGINLYKVLYLYQTPSKFYIQPVEQPGEVLIIDRQTCEITSNCMFSVGLLPANATSCLIYGIVGIKHLLSCPYLIVVTKAIQIGLVCGEPVYRMDQAKVIPFFQSVSQPREGQYDWNATYFGMLESVLQTPSYYFSYSHDLTNTLQRISAYQALKGSETKLKDHHYYDKRFLWNSHVMSDFDRYSEITERYRLPFIHGFVSINKVPFGSLSWSLISRRSVRRAGTRFNSRGADQDGNVSNFVETEQITEEQNTGNRASFVQVRGSIPLIWGQKANYAYKPTIEINHACDQDLALRKHFDDLKDHYNNISIVNLIDHRGHEGKLEYEFSQRVGYLQKYYNIAYHYFDFHKECSKMRWHRLNILLDQIQTEIETYGYFECNKDVVIRSQTGVIRSNCIDSLDRTNVVQSMIAKCVLERQLKKFNAIPRETKIDYYLEFMDIFKNAWADNADALSIQYAGTPALKTDFTRTGQRTQLGLVKDGINSLTRYVENNFRDNYRQDAIDLFLGHYEGYPSPLYKPMDLTTYTSTLPVTIVMLTLVVLFIYFRY